MNLFMNLYDLSRNPKNKLWQEMVKIITGATVLAIAVGAGKKTNRGNKWKPSHHLWQCDNWERWYYNKQQVLTAQEQGSWGRTSLQFLEKDKTATLSFKLRALRTMDITSRPGFPKGSSVSAVLLLEQASWKKGFYSQISLGKSGLNTVICISLLLVFRVFKRLTCIVKCLERTHIMECS